MALNPEDLPAPDVFGRLHLEEAVYHQNLCGSSVDGLDVAAGKGRDLVLPSPGKFTYNVGNARSDIAVHRRTQWLLCAVSLVEAADAQLLPSTFKALEVDLGLSPVGLGKMSLAQSLLQSITSPVWGALADRCSRKFLLVFSCTAWAVLTLLLSCARSVGVIIALRCAHGATLASLGPIAQSIVADVAEPEERGIVFGRLHFAMHLGQVVASLVGVSMADTTLAYGIRGWRVLLLLQIFPWLDYPADS